MANRRDRIISSNRRREMDIMRLIPRNSYMEKIINVIGTPDIKVITGVRRCGKSKLLESFKKYIDENIQDILKCLSHVQEMMNTNTKV